MDDKASAGVARKNEVTEPVPPPRPEEPPRPRPASRPRRPVVLAFLVGSFAPLVVAGEVWERLHHAEVEGANSRTRLGAAERELAAVSADAVEARRKLDALVASAEAGRKLDERRAGEDERERERAWTPQKRAERERLRPGGSYCSEFVPALPVGVWDRRGDASVLIESATIRKVPFTRTLSHGVTLSDNPYLVVAVRVLNHSATQALAYRRWREERDGAVCVRDELGYRYRVHAFDGVAFGNGNAVVPPGGEHSDALIVEPPVAPTRSLYLDLDSPCGDGCRYRFELTSKDWLAKKR